jgi:hypothetical protein
MLNYKVIRFACETMWLIFKLHNPKLNLQENVTKDLEENNFGISVPSISLQNNYTSNSHLQ